MATAASSVSSSSWRQLVSEAQLAEIERARAAVASAGGVVTVPGATYGIICRVCQKPNQPHTTFCTGCSFPTSPHDLQRLPDNIFLDLVQGRDIGATVHYRDADLIVFDDKYGVSANHLDIIPTQVFADISVLAREHVPMLERLYEAGKRVLLARHLAFLEQARYDDGGEDDNASLSTSATATTTAATAAQQHRLTEANFDRLVSAGYNFPVSVKHLHLHMLLPPYRHDKILQYPRWHAHTKVLADLRTHGAVQLYNEHADDVEGPREQARAIENSRRVERWLQQQQQQQQQ